MRPSALLVALALALVSGCPKPPPGPPKPVALTREDRLAVARLEAQRDAAVPRLMELARDANPERRGLALRALGRVATPEAIGALRRALAGEDAVAAAAALGVAGATGALDPADAKAITGELAALAVTGPARAVVVEAIGRLGAAEAVAPLTSALGSDDPATAAAAGLALGRLGRAKIALDATAELALIGRTKDERDEIRYAATYGLARAFIAPGTPPPAATDLAVRALRDRLSDREAPTRAAAVAGLAARRAVAVTTPDLLDALDDADWRVAVELVRALGGPAATDATRTALVPFLARVAEEWAGGRLPAPFAHVLLEGLRQVTDRAAEVKVRALLVAVARSYTDQPPSSRPRDQQLAAAWAKCLALAALARPLPTAPGGDSLNDPAVAMSQLAVCGNQVLPDHLVQGLTLDVIAAGGAGDRVRRLVIGAGHGDARVASAAIGHLAELGKTASAADRAAIRDALIAGVNRTEPPVAGAAAEAAGTLMKELGSGGDWAPLAAAVVARVELAGGDAELTTTLLGAIAVAKLDGLPTCQRLQTHVSSALRGAARECVKELTGEDPGARTAAGPPPMPPVDPDAALRGAATWRITTSQGEVAIALDPEVAPWHVAAIITLTRDRFYDGLSFHRVVPDFVVQGGDPTGTGWGGPGFTLPSEPGSLIENHAVPYAPGAAGIADSGKDTGGSQWFVMHGPAPHLEGRYTRVGAVIEGADVIDRLQVGDTIVRARIE